MTASSVGPSSAAATSGLAARIAAGERLLGGLLRLPNELLIESAGLHGFDFAILDCEHGPAEISLILHHVMIGRAVGMPVLVRLPAGDADGILRVLDAGAIGLLVPRISDAGDVRRAIGAAAYPPQGERGFATYTTAGRYGLTPAPDHLAAAAASLVVFAMIEDSVGVDNAAAIVAEAGVTGTMVGPADLSVNLGRVGAVTHPDVVAATRQVHEATRAAGRAVMVIVGRPEAAAAAYAAGAQLVLINLAQPVNDALAGMIGVRNAAAG